MKIKIITIFALLALSLTSYSSTDVLIEKSDGSQAVIPIITLSSGKTSIEQDLSDISVEKFVCYSSREERFIIKKDIKYLLEQLNFTEFQVITDYYSATIIIHTQGNRIVIPSCEDFFNSQEQY